MMAGSFRNSRQRFHFRILFEISDPTVRTVAQCDLAVARIRDYQSLLGSPSRAMKFRSRWPVPPAVASAEDSSTSITCWREGSCPKESAEPRSNS